MKTMINENSKKHQSKTKNQSQSHHQKNYS